MKEGISIFSVLNQSERIGISDPLAVFLQNEHFYLT